MNGSTRRAVLATGAGAALATAAAGLTYTAGPAGAAGTADAAAGDDGIVPFRGTRQAGIITAAQDRLHLVALDVVTDDPDALRDLLTAWTVAAERMTHGAEAAPGGVVGGGPWNVPQDTGEEERYSHTDLWDFDANFEGSLAAIDALRPFLKAKNPTLLATIDQRAAALDEVIDTHKKGDGFVLYTALTPADVKALTEALDAFSEPVATVAGEVAST